MNAPAPLSSRRNFLTRLFGQAGSEAGKTELRPLDKVRRETDGVLWAFATDSEGAVYLAGDDGVVLLRRSDEWQREAFPAPLPIHALCARRDELYSVGWLGLICVRRAGHWLRLQGGDNASDSSNLPLFDIAADQHENLWAVGDQGRVVEFNGTDWLEHDSGSEANLRSVLPLADGRILASGLGGTVLSYDGELWTEVDTQSGCPIVSMAQLGDGAVLAVGGEYDVAQGCFLGRMFLYSDSKWLPIESEYPLPRLRRVRQFGEQMLICGDDGTVFRWTAEGARRLPARLRYDLHDCICLSDGRAMICGDGGTLLHEIDADPDKPVEQAREAVMWQRIGEGLTNRTLRTILALGNEQLLAAGDGGVVLHIEGDTATLRETPQKLRIHDLWASSPRNIYAACDDATILHFDGQQWQVAHKGEVDTALLAISGFGPHDIFAVGDNGYALRYDGLMWRQLETGIRQELYGLWGHDSQHLLAVGGGGLVLRWNGDQWKSFSAGTDYDLYGVAGAGLEKLFLCGLAGTLVRFEDNAWHRDYSGVRSDLHDLCNSGGTFYAVGSNGSILCNREGVWEAEHSGFDNTLQAITSVDGELYAIGSGGMVLKRG